MKTVMFTVGAAIALFAADLRGPAQEKKPPRKKNNDPVAGAYRGLGAKPGVLVLEKQSGRLELKLDDSPDKRPIYGEELMPVFHFQNKFLPNREFIDLDVPFALSFTYLTEKRLTELVQRPDLADLKNLKVLSLGGERGDEMTPAAFKELAKLNNVAWLNLQGNVPVAALKELKGMKSLTTLYLSRLRITDAYLADLREADMLHLLNWATARDGKRPKSAKEVIALDLSYTYLTDVGLKELVILENLEQLKAHNLFRSFKTTATVTEAGLKGLAGLKKLNTLDIHLSATDTSLRVLHEIDLLQALLWAKARDGSRPKSAQEVYSLDLSSAAREQPVTDIGLKELTGLKNLVVLDLRRTRVTDAGLKNLAGLKKLVTLELPMTVTEATVRALRGIGLLHTLARATGKGRSRPQSEQEVEALDLRGLEITDADLKELAALKNLTSLDLAGTQVTDAGLKDLAGLKKLATLNLPMPVTDATLRALRDIDLLHALSRSSARDGKRPQSAQEIDSLDLFDTQIGDAGLKELAGLKDLTIMDLRGTNVTDAGLKELAGLKSLSSLRLERTKVTDAGLKELAALTKLTTLSLPAVSDTTVRTLREIDLLHALVRATAKGGGRPNSLQQVHALDLQKTQFTDAGVKALVEIPNLVELDLTGNRVTDIGLRELDTLPKLGKLKLGDNTRITDVGLKRMAELKNLSELYLPGTDITDAGLKELAGLSRLRRLDIGATKVTAAGLKALAGLPRLKQLDADGTKISSIELASFRRTLDYRERDRMATIMSYRRQDAVYGGWSKGKLGQLVFTPGPKVDDDAIPGFRFQRQPFASLRDLDEPFGLSFEGVNMTGNTIRSLNFLKLLVMLDLNGTSIDDTGLKYLSSHGKLSILYLGGAKVTDRGLKELAGLVNLVELDLSLTQVTDAGLKSLAGMKNLAKLELGGTSLTDAGLKELTPFKNLTYLDLTGTKLTDAGLKDLAALKSLTTLDLESTKVSDTGLKELTRLTNLTRLNLRKTQVSAAGVAEFGKALPKCNIMR